MKGIIAIFFLTLMLISCGEESKSSIISENNGINLKNIDFEKETNLLEKELIKNRKDTKIIKHYSSLSLNLKVKLNCEELGGINIIEDCIKIRKEAIQRMEIQKSNFTLDLCEDKINKKYLSRDIFLSKLPEDEKKIYEKYKKMNKDDSIPFKEKEIEICEIQFALENDDCGLIDDKVKNNKCEKFKIKLDEERELNAIKNFRIEDHIK